MSPVLELHGEAARGCASLRAVRWGWVSATAESKLLRAEALGEKGGFVLGESVVHRAEGAERSVRVPRSQADH